MPHIPAPPKETYFERLDRKLDELLEESSRPIEHIVATPFKSFRPPTEEDHKSIKIGGTYEWYEKHNTKTPKPSLIQRIKRILWK